MTEKSFLKSRIEDLELLQKYLYSFEFHSLESALEIMNMEMMRIEPHEIVSFLISNDNCIVVLYISGVKAKMLEKICPLIKDPDV